MWGARSLPELQIHPPHFQGLGGPDPRVPRAPCSPRLGGNLSSLPCEESGVQIETGLVWENLVPQEPVIGAWGSTYSSGEVMESSLAGFRRNSGNFTTRLSESPPPQPLKWGQSPKQVIFSCWAGPGRAPLPWAEATGGKEVWVREVGPEELVSTWQWQTQQARRWGLHSHSDE